jgi:hypothetical protein
MKLVLRCVYEILVMFFCLLSCLSFMNYSSFSTVPGKLKLTPIG